MAESIHAQRAKRWFMTPFVSEWLENAVKYCKHDPEGKRRFEAWVVTRFGQVEGRNQLKLCQKPPRRVVPLGITSSFDQRGGMERPAAEFGVSPEAMLLYHQFTSEESLVLPKRTKPAPKRHRGESSIDWLARRHEALLDGCKVPNIDWGIARAIAISELDRTTDTMKIWRTNPEIFVKEITRRSESYIPSQESIQSNTPEQLRMQKMHDAFRALQRGLNLAHMTWSFAVDLFDDLARMGYTTTSSIERAYQKDSKLVWRIVSLFVKVNVLQTFVLGKLADALSWSEHFRPYFRRSRAREGYTVIARNEAHISANKLTGIEDIIVRAACKINGPYAVGFFHAICDSFKRDPTQAKKFSEEAFDVMGEAAIVHEFFTQTATTDFGFKLQKMAAAVDSSNYMNHPDFLSQVSFMDPNKYLKKDDGTAVWGYAKVVVGSINYTLLGIVSQTSMIPLGQTQEQMDNVPPALFDQMWFNVDKRLWDLVLLVDRPGAQGTAARHLGLIDPTDPKRPMYAKQLFKYLDPTRGRPFLLGAPPPSSTELPTHLSGTGKGDRYGTSGHAYLSQNSDVGGKDRLKTRGIARPEYVVVDAGKPGEGARNLFEDEEDVVDFPNLLPSEFKLGKKAMKVFHRILDPGNDGEGDEDNGLQKGQVRWMEFEKAMRRIGFAVCQTAGSSVRFDPPAKMARPITFHRPHPDSILTPQIIKLMGARLKRCYGWTVSTFTQGVEVEA